MDVSSISNINFEQYSFKILVLYCGVLIAIADVFLFLNVLLKQHKFLTKTT